MTRQQEVKFQVCLPEDRSALVELLWTLRGEYHFYDRGTIERLLDAFYIEGGIMGAFLGDEIVGMFGYMLRRADLSEVNRLVGGIETMVFRPEYRHSRILLRGISLLTQYLVYQGVAELRCYAAIDDRYANRLYARLGRMIALVKNRIGFDCVLYACSVEDILEKTERPAQQPRRDRPSVPVQSLQLAFF